MNNWLIGFDKEVTTPIYYKSREYYIAGYDRGIAVKSVLDDTYVRTIALKVDEQLIVIAVIDCIGLANIDVLEIREGLKIFAAENKITYINIATTHVHDAVDTQGLWGKGIKSGRDKRYMKYLKFLVKKSIIAAVKNIKEGQLFFGYTKTQDMICDVREPFVYDENLYRFRFVPIDGSAELYILNFGVHPELLGKKKYMISADYPCYMGKKIYAEKQADFILINGAIGAISNFGIKDIWDGRADGEKRMKEYGEKMGEYALNIANERTIEPKLVFKIKRIKVPAENKIFKLAKTLGVISTPVMRIRGKEYKYYVESELGYLQLGDVKAVLVPGELFPELALGGTLSAQEATSGKELNRVPMFDLMGEGTKLVFGLMNDEIGYIIPENDFYLHPDKPYSFWAIPQDKFGRFHYEETTCSGPYAAKAIWDALNNIMSEVNGDK